MKWWFLFKQKTGDSAMKKIIIISLPLVCLVTQAWSEGIGVYEDCDDVYGTLTTGELLYMPDANCSYYRIKCYDGSKNGQPHSWALPDCKSCAGSNYVPSDPEEITIPWDIIYSQPMFETALVSTRCVKYICNESTNCISDTSYKSGNAGYEYKVNRSCVSNECKTTNVYRCASGYYGTSSNGTSGCSRCPLDTATGMYGNSPAGASTIIACYQPSGRTGSDSTGTFVYTSNCGYQN